MIEGVGIGLRTDHLEQIAQGPSIPVQFLEFAPENWMGVGGRRRQLFDKVRANYPMVCHGLTLNIGGMAPINIPFLERLKNFLDELEIDTYSDHLCFSADEGQLFDLFPLPHTEEAIAHVSERVKIVQEVLERPIALENISSYANVHHTMPEHEFVKQVILESNCQLLLDANNVYVNSQNHGFDPKTYLKALSDCPIAYYHIAGHTQKKNRLVDTHGSPICQEVFEVLEHTYQILGVQPTLLERDNQIPPLPELIEEAQTIKGHQAKETIHAHKKTTV